MPANALQGIRTWFVGQQWICPGLLAHQKALQHVPCLIDPLPIQR